MKSVFILSLALALTLCAASTLPGAPTVTAPCEEAKKKCSTAAAKFVAGIVRPLEACKAFRSCKRVCRKEKRSGLRTCRRSKRSCRRQCRGLRRRRHRRRCRRSCRKTKRRCARAARKTKRVCRRSCRTTYKTRACKKARRGIFTSGLKAVPACASFISCSNN